ncbi:MAG: hypothetical protein GX660_17230 [Clostridiaceae bacterium]|nr:hypothetical protein [Clostridiaceae bacterium]
MKEFGVNCMFNYLGPSKPAIPLEEATALKLQPGEQVKVFQDNATWTGTIIYDENLPKMYRWYAKLD